jgi:hypothetical protein
LLDESTRARPLGARFARSPEAHLARWSGLRFARSNRSSGTLK